MASRISSKDSFNERVLSGGWEEVFLFVFMVLDFVEGDVGKGVKAVDRSGGDRGTGDDVRRAVRDVKEGIIFLIVEDGPSKLGGWGMWDRDNG